MKFKGTWIFSAIVIAVVGFAIYDYRRAEKASVEQATEKQIFRGKSSDDVASIKVERPQGLLHLKRENGRWKMIAPVEDNTEISEVDSFVSGILTQEVKTMGAGDGAKDLAQYGLDKPEFKVEIGFSDGQTSNLEFGSARAYDDGYYLRKDGGDVLISGTGWSFYLTRQANELRDKNLYVSYGGEIVGVTVKSKGQAPFKFVRADGVWRLDNQPKFRVDETALEEFINKLRHLKADSIVADDKKPASLRKYALMPEQAQTAILVNTEGETAEWQVFISAEKDSKVHLVASSHPAVYEASLSRVIDLRPALSQFRNKTFPFEYDLAKVNQIRMVKKGADSEMRYTKIKGEWEIDVENPHQKADGAKIDNFLSSLRALKVKKYLGRAKWNAKEVRENRIQLLDDMRQQVFLFEWGGNQREQEQDFYLAKSSLADEVFTVAKSDLDAIVNQNLHKDEPPPASTSK